jgi:hypothetical protein
MRPRWLAWAAFYFALVCHGFSRIHTDQAAPALAPAQPSSYLKIRFLFSYTWHSTYAAEKILFVSSFPKLPRDVHKRLKATIAFALQS